MADDDAATAADQAAEAPADEEERHQAVHEILAELRGESETDQDPDDPAPDPEPDDALPAPPATDPEPDGVEQDEDPEPVGGPPAGDRSAPPSHPESPAPRQRQADKAGPRSLLPLASTPRSLILLHALSLGVACIIAWVACRHVASTLAAVRYEVGRIERRGTRTEGGARAASSVGAAIGPRTPPPAPILQVDEGLRYVQEVEQADVRFVKGEYAAAAAGYARALESMPRHWDDGACAYRLAESYLRLRDYPRAVAAFEEVAVSYPSRYKPRALYKLGDVYLTLGAYEKARKAFYDLLLLQGRYGEDAKSHIQLAHYRIADCYRLEAESLAGLEKEDTR